MLFFLKIISVNYSILWLHISTKAEFTVFILQLLRLKEEFSIMLYPFETSKLCLSLQKHSFVIFKGGKIDEES